MPSNQIQQEEEISLKELVYKMKAIWSYLIKKWVFILFAGIIGAGIGFVYAWFQPVKYQSRLSFVVEESKAGVGGLASLAGQFGFDVGGGAGGGVFSGENILLFLKSENLCRDVLLTPYDASGKSLLADKYAEANDLKSAWSKKKELGQISFVQYKNGAETRLGDSLLKVIVGRVLKNELSVSKPDKKASFIEVTVTMRDELLSKYFVERLVAVATERYVDSKIKLKTLNVAKLQRRADSLGLLLNSRTYSVAAQQQNLVDLNPALKTASVSSEITSRDKTMIATIFAEVTKNLEVAKVALSQETPSIQIVDTPILPLKQEKTSKLWYLLIGGTICGLSVVFFLLIKKQLQ
jgi:hypothetical protein